MSFYRRRQDGSETERHAVELEPEERSVVAVWTSTFGERRTFAHRPGPDEGQTGEDEPEAHTRPAGE